MCVKRLGEVVITAVDDEYLRHAINDALYAMIRMSKAPKAQNNDAYNVIQFSEYIRRILICMMLFEVFLVTILVLYQTV